MKQYLVIARHGEYGGGDSSPLSEMGRKQMSSLKKVIDAFVAKTFGKEETRRIRLSFSDLPRAIESTQALEANGEDIVVKHLYMANREDIYKPQNILENVMGIANHYGANIIVIIAHGDMPAVLTETAHESVTGKKLDNKKPSVAKGCGYITDMTTGEVVYIRFDDFDAKPVVQAKKPETTLHTTRQHTAATAKARTVEVPSPYAGRFTDLDDDIPF